MREVIKLVEKQAEVIDKMIENIKEIQKEIEKLRKIWEIQKERRTWTIGMYYSGTRKQKQE